jgi:hypothetical protein
MIEMANSMHNPRVHVTTLGIFPAKSRFPPRNPDRTGRPGNPCFCLNNRPVAVRRVALAAGFTGLDGGRK